MSKKRQRIMLESELSEGQTRKFSVPRNGKPTDAFVARFKGKIVAYVNLCRHIPLSLDYGDNRFFTNDGEHFICETHGAIYDPLNGVCVRGPCAGEALHPVSIVVENGVIWAAIESQDPAAGSS